MPQQDFETERSDNESETNTRFFYKEKVYKKMLLKLSKS